MKNGIPPKLVESVTKTESHVPTQGLNQEHVPPFDNMMRFFYSKSNSVNIKLTIQRHNSNFNFVKFENEFKNFLFLFIFLIYRNLTLQLKSTLDIEDFKD